jgi:hypothetical protein
MESCRRVPGQRTRIHLSDPDGFGFQMGLQSLGVQAGDD